jgi:RNA polymerase sigma factor (sigma-70 family)
VETVLAETGQLVAIDETIRAERQRLLEFIRRRVRLDADAEDIVQDVLVQWVGYGVAEPIEKLTSWLFTVARNRITDWYRKRKPDAFSTLQPDRGDEGHRIGLDELLSDPNDLPDLVNLRGLVWEELEEALEELPERQREVFVMYELEGMSFKEIAAATGEPVNTLISRKRYAVLALRSRLQELYDDMIDD